MTPDGVEDEYGAKAEGALLDAIAGRRPPGSGSITGSTLLGDLLTRYIERCREDGDLAPKSIDTYEATINTVKSRFVGIRVSEAEPDLLNDILKGIRRDHGATRERHTKVALNAVMTDAVMARAIATNPVREIPVRKRKKAEKAKGAPHLEVEQVRGLLEALATSEVCEQKDLRDPVIVLAATGLRRSELLALRWEDVDLDGRVLTAAASVVRLKGRGLVRQDRTKGGGDERSLSLPRFAADALRRRKDEWTGPNTAGVIFPSSTGTLRDPDNFGKQWREVRDDLGLPDVSSHSFRKSIATLIDDAGLSDRIAADQLGHAKVSMTTDVYMSRGKIHTEVADVLDKVVGISDE